MGAKGGGTSNTETNSTNATTSLLNDDQARPADYADAADVLYLI